MKRNKGFTLLELLIALVISSFIIIAVTRLLNQSTLIINRGRDFSIVDRTVGILFNQMDKDISSVYMPYIYRDKGKKTDKEFDEHYKLLDDFFVGKFREDASAKIAGKKRELFQSLNFITTNPIQVYGQTKKRFARVKYELILNKEKTKAEQNSYDLYRYETSELENVKFKESEEGIKKSPKIFKHLVANNIKGLYVEYGKEISQDNPVKEKKKYFYIWDKKELPKAIKIHLILWNSKMTMEFLFDALIPIYSLQDKPEKKAQNVQKK